MKPSIHRNKLRRLRLLQFLYQACPNTITDTMLLMLAKEDPDLDPDMKMVRRSLYYLAQRGLAVVDSLGEVWTAQITAAGMEYLEADTDPGVDGMRHPSEFMTGGD